MVYMYICRIGLQLRCHNIL